MKTRIAMALLSTSLAAAAQVPSGPTIDRIRQSGTIVLAHRESSVPLSYVDKDQKPVGYAVELCQRIAAAVQQKLGLKKLDIAYKVVSGSTRIPTIVEGKADLECGSTTNNAERREKVAFTIPHYITGARYLVRSDSAIGELTDFERKRLASTKSTTPLTAITKANAERLIHIDIVEAPDHEAAFAMLEKKQIDGFAMDDVLLYGLRSRSANPQQYKVVGKFLTVEALAIMLGKGDPAFKLIVDEEMKRLIASREAYAIYDKWFLKPIPPRKVALELPMNYLLRDFWKYPSDWVPN